MRPENGRFTKTHEYALIEGDVATCGLTDFATEHLSDLVFIELPEVGSSVSANTPFGEVESVKAVADVSSPVSGEVIEVNEPIADNLETLSADPYGAGWVIKVRMSDPSEVDDLMDLPTYVKFMESESEVN